MQKSPRQKMGGKKLSLEKHKSRVNLLASIHLLYNGHRRLKEDGP